MTSTMKNWEVSGTNPGYLFLEVKTMTINELLILIPGIIKFGTNVIKGYKNAKKKKKEKEYIKAVRSGDDAAVNRFIHS